MKRLVILILCLTLLLLPMSAPALVRMPQCRGVLTDDANVLSAQTASDLAEYAARLEAETGMVLRVALVHFLDGTEVQSYANALFDLWELEEDHLLLLGAAGEDVFAVSCGSETDRKIGASSVENLLYTTSFGALFRSQQYDAAAADFCLSLNALVEKQLGQAIRTDGLFGQAVPTPAQQVQAFGSELWNDIAESISGSSRDYQEHYEHKRREENGLTAGGWIVLIILVLIIFRQNKYDRRKRREAPGCVGWLFGLLGINILIDILRRKRR